MGGDVIRILVTGAGGFIGSHMVAYLREKGFVVIGVDQEWPEMRQEWWSKCHWRYTKDLRDARAVGDVFAAEKPQWVLHFASDMGGVGYFHAHDYYPYINNMTMDMNILKACEMHRIERLFYSSSACIYPTHLQKDVFEPFIASENRIYPANADQMYGWEKLMMTQLCERAPLDARVGIFHTIYGPGQEWDGERAKFPPSIVRKVIDSARTGESIEIWGGGNQLRTFCYVDDAVEKIFRILTMPYSEPVNVAGDQLVSVMDVAEMVCDIVGTKKVFSHNEKQPSGVLARGADNSEFIRRYYYQNQHSLRDGYSRLFSWLESALDTKYPNGID